MERHAVYSTPMTAQREHVLTRSHIPEHDAVIVAGGSEASAIGAECDLIHAVSVPGQFMMQVPVRRVVEPNDRIRSPPETIVFPSGLKPANITADR